MKKLFLFLLMLPSLFCSCSNDDDDTTKSENDRFNLNITWNGQQYTVPCSLDKNGNLQYWSEEFKSVYNNEIAQYEDSLVTYATGDSSISYYPSVNAMMKDLGLRFLDQRVVKSEEDKAGTRVASNTIAGNVYMWSGTDFNGSQLNHRTFYTSFYWCARLSHLQYNDMARSVRVVSNIPHDDYVYVNYSDVVTKYNEGTYFADPPTGSTKYATNDLRVVFIAYEDTRYRGKVLCMIPENTNYKEYAKLSTIGWDKMISSVVMRIAVKDLYQDRIK